MLNLKKSYKKIDITNLFEITVDVKMITIGNFLFKPNFCVRGGEGKNGFE